MESTKHLWETPNQFINPELTFRYKCKIKILILGESNSVTYDMDQIYGLGEFVHALTHELPAWVNVEVQKAHRDNPINTPDPDVKYNYRFNTAAKLSQYQAIFLFGVSGANGAGSLLSNAEHQELANFMDNGGGVFATGDHENLGSNISGHIPRVRTMRRWFNTSEYGMDPAPVRSPNGTDNPLDTLVNAVGNREGDLFPQTIRPRYYSNSYINFLFQTRHPHQVLCGRSGVINYLPDHMHEGICVTPPNNRLQYGSRFGSSSNEPEYPENTSGYKVLPQVISWGTNTIDNQEFGVMSAYDGHLVNGFSSIKKKRNVGRVFVDSTWHHFFSYNVNSMHVNYENIRQNLESGLSYPANDPNYVAYKKYGEIRDYYRNIMFWLCRKSMQRCLKNRGFLIIAQHIEIQSAFLSEKIWTIPSIYDIGSKAYDALNQHAPQCEIKRYIFDIFYPIRYKYVEFSGIDLPEDFDKKKLKIDAPWISQDYIRKVALGGAIATAAEVFSLEKLKKEKEELDDDKIHEVLTKGAMKAIEMLREKMKDSFENLDQLLRPERKKSPRRK